MDSPIAAVRPQDFYRLASGSVVPRPIAWISTCDARGVPNLAPFSFFTVASIAPPVLAFSHVNRRDLRDKDTLVNLLHGGGCVVHTVAQAMAEAMNLSSAEIPPDCDEFALAGLAMIDSHCVAAPSLRDAAVRFECRLRDIVRFGEQPMAGQLVLLDVVHVSVDETMLDERGHVDSARLDLVGKLGGDGYCTTHERFTLARPTSPR